MSTKRTTPMEELAVQSIPGSGAPDRGQGLRLQALSPLDFTFFPRQGGEELANEGAEERRKSPHGARAGGRKRPVPQELYVQSTRADKSERISREQAARLIEWWLRFPVKEIGVALMQAVTPRCVPIGDPETLSRPTAT